MENTKSIEENGIAILKLKLSSCASVDKNIYENDKTPFTDGSLLLYSDDHHAKSHFEQEIRCQVKTTIDSKVKNNKEYRRLDRSTLKGYQRIGGQLLFVVWIKSSNNAYENQIFYQNLNSIYISRLLSSTNNKYPVIPLTEFPQKPDQQMKVLKQVALDLNNTKTYRSLSKRTDKPDRIVIPTYLLDPESFTRTMKNLENQTLTTYAIYDNHPEPIGVFTSDDVQKLEIGQEKIINFGAELGSFSAKMLAKQSKKDDFISILTGAEGHLIIKVMTKKEHEQRIILKVKKASTLDNQLINLRIMRRFIDKPTFKLDGNKMDFTKYMQDISKSKKEEIDSSIESLQIINKVGRKLGIDFYSDLENSQLVDQMNQILDFVSSRKELDKNQLIVKTFEYGQGYVGIAETCDNYWNLFSKNMEKNIIIYGGYENDIKHMVKANPYLLAMRDNYPIDKYLGYDFSIVKEWFSNNRDKFKNEFVLQQAREFTEELISCAVENNQKSGLYLKQASRILDMVPYDNKHEILFLDHMLIIKRLKKNMTKNDMKRLYSLLNSSTLVIRIYASYLLRISADQEDLNNVSDSAASWLGKLGIITNKLN